MKPLTPAEKKAMRQAENWQHQSNGVRRILQAVASEPVGHCFYYGEHCPFCYAYGDKEHKPDCVVLVAQELCNKLGWLYNTGAVWPSRDDPISESGVKAIVCFPEDLEVAKKILAAAGYDMSGFGKEP